MPGDAVLADENGILFLEPDMIEATAKRGIELQEAEGPRLARVAKGERLPKISTARTPKSGRSSPLRPKVTPARCRGLRIIKHLPA